MYFLTRVQEAAFRGLTSASWSAIAAIASAVAAIFLVIFSIKSASAAQKSVKITHNPIVGIKAQFDLAGTNYPVHVKVTNLVDSPAIRVDHFGNIQLVGESYNWKIPPRRIPFLQKGESEEREVSLADFISEARSQIHAFPKFVEDKAATVPCVLQIQALYKNHLGQLFCCTYRADFEVTIGTDFKIGGLFWKVNTETNDYDNLKERKYSKIVKDLYEADQRTAAVINVECYDAISVKAKDIFVQAPKDENDSEESS